jgi:CRISPR-associated protein Cas6
MIPQHLHHVDAAFPLRGQAIPIQHGYALFAALSRRMPELRARRHWSVHPVQGQPQNRGALALTERSRVKLRLPAEEISQILGLAGAELDIEGRPVTLGFPKILPLIPAPYLRSRLVVIKHASLGADPDPEQFILAVRRQLARVPDLGQDPERVEVEIGPRRVLRVKSVAIAGHAVILRGFEAQGSIAVQIHGIGGRRHMGAGVFVPPRRSA